MDENKSLSTEVEEKNSLNFLTPAEMEKLNQEAQEISQEIVQLAEHGDDRFDKMLEQMGNIGNDVQRKSTSSIEILKRPLKELTDRQYGNIPETLTRLRATTRQLNPRGLQQNGVRGIVSKILRQKPVQKFIQKYETVDKHIKDITEDLLSGKDQLEADIIELNSIKKDSFENIANLQKQVYLGKRYADAIEEKKNLPQFAKQKDLIDRSHSKILVRVTNMQQMINVLQQSITSINIITDNNEKLKEAINNAVMMTSSLLTVSATVNVALSQQTRVLDAVDSVNKSMEELITGNARLLKENSKKTTKRMEDPSISVEKLKQAYSDIEEAIRISEESNRKVIASRKRFYEEMEQLNNHMGAKLLPVSDEKTNQKAIEN